MKNAARLAAGLVLSATFLTLAARGVSWGEVADALGRARPGHVLLAGAGMILSLGFRALRWGVLIEPIHPVGRWRLFSATCIGFAANMLLPLRAGEIVRPWVISRREPVPFAQAMGTIALDRLFDMGALLMLFGFGGAHTAATGGVAAVWIGVSRGVRGPPRRARRRDRPTRGLAFDCGDHPRTSSGPDRPAGSGVVRWVFHRVSKSWEWPFRRCCRPSLSRSLVVDLTQFSPSGYLLSTSGFPGSRQPSW